MNRRRLPATILTALLALPAARAQTGALGAGTVAGRGTAEIQKPPQFLRVQIAVSAKGKDLKEALTQLKQRRELIKARLGELGAVAGTVVMGDAALGGEKNDQQRQMEMMLSQRFRAAGKTVNKNKPKLTEVTFSLRFDVPIKAGDCDELLLAAEHLQAKVKAADLAGRKQSGKLTPQEEELAEEGKIEDAGNPVEVKPGEPSFMFVRKLTDAEVAQALARAFARAKEEASQLAAAADVKLGPLANLETSYQAGNEEESQFMSRYDPTFALRWQMAASSTQAREAIGLRPGMVSYRIAIAAHFQLKAKP